MSETPDTAAEEVVVAAADDAAPPAQTTPATEIEQAAAKGGWLPKDEFKGDPANWVDAPQFVLKAAEILPQITADLKEARAEIKAVKQTVAESAKFISAAEKRAYERGLSEAQKRLDEAASMGDVEGVRAAHQDIVDLGKEAVSAAPAAEELTPEFVAWKGDNPWFGKDKALTAAAVAIANEAESEGYRDKALIKETANRIREKFPHLYTNPNRERAPAVEGAGNGSRKPGQSYSDMPPEAREMCTFFEKSTKGFDRNRYVKDYFKGQSA